MDTRTPPIPLKHQERKERQTRKQEKSPEPVSLPPLTPVPNNCRHQQQQPRPKNPGPGGTWTRCPPHVTRNSDCQRRRPYRVLHIGATPLMHACQQADRSRVLRLLKEQEDTVGYRDRTLRSALHYCMDAGTGGAVASAAPELVNAPDAEGHTPLHLAVIAGDTQLVAVLLANGADVNAKDVEGHSVLHWATVCGEAECVRLVLAAGARPSTPDLRGGSPLHYAAQCCGAAVTAELSVPKKVGLKVLQTLLEFGADVNAKDEDGRQPILWAASAGSVEAVLALARAGGSAAAGATDKDGLTALHCAASRGHARCVEALVNLCGSHPDHVDDNGCSALHYAATLGHADATALLLRLGADPDRQDRKGRTPALCAAAKGQLETLKILAHHGASLHARTVRGTGVAHEAVVSGRIELIEWLARKRPSTLDIATHDGKTPLHVAALHGHLDVCKVLLDRGARVNAVLRTSKSGPMTALDAALHRGHRDCAKLVQMHGGTTAQRLRTRNTAPNRVFAAKLRVKRDESSTESETTEGRRVGARRAPRDSYVEERWIEKRTRRRGGGGSPRRTKDRRGSRSFSEEEIRLGKTSRRERERGRRTRSESARYEERPGPERPGRNVATTGRTRGGHEFGGSTSETSGEEVEGTRREERRRSRSREEVRKVARGEKGEDRRNGSSENIAGSEEDEEEDDEDEDDDEEDQDDDEEERSLSDDSLEVVVVKRSLEKTSEKVQISGRGSMTPRETSRETRVTETRRRCSRRKSRTGRSASRCEGIEEREEKEEEDEEGEEEEEDRKRGKVGGRSRKTRKTKKRESRREEERTSGGEANREEERRSKERRFRRDVTDSTSQETVERVTVVAQVHKDQAPDTPKGPAEVQKGSGSVAPTKKEQGEEKDARSEMDEILERADELQNALMTRAADLRKDVEDIRRQMTSGSSQDDGRTPRGEKGSPGAVEEGQDGSEGSDEPVTVAERRSEKSPGSSWEGTDEGVVVEATGEKKAEEGRRKSLQVEEDAKREDGSSSAGDDKSLGDGTTDGSSGNLRSRPSTAKRRISDARRKSVSSSSVDKEPRSQESRVEGEKSSLESGEEVSGASRSSGEKTLETVAKESGKSQESGDAGGKDSGEEASGRSQSSGEKAIRVDEDEKANVEAAAAAEEAVQSTEGKAEAAAEGKEETGEAEKPSKSEEAAKKEEKVEEEGREDERSELPGTGKLRFIDSSSGSAKSRPSTGRNGRGERSKSPSKRSLFESSEERSPDRSAIVAVIESPEWDDEDDEEIKKEIRRAVGEDGEDDETEPEDEDGLGVLRVLPSTSEEETPRMPSAILRAPKTDAALPRVDRRTRVKHEDATSPRMISRDARATRAKQRRDSGGRDSGIEPSPRVSKIPKRKTVKCCPNTEKQQALNMDTVTRDVQISLRRYHLERKIFFQLMELKRLQIRHGRANEHVLVKRQVETFHKAGMSGPALGVAKYDQPLTFRHFEAFLYEQLRRLQRRPATPDFCTEAKQCTQKTHRCHHATSAYTSVPVYTYLGGGGQEREESLLPRIESRGRGQMTVEVTRGEEKQVIELPTEKLDRTKRYFVTFTVRGEGQDNESSSGEKPAARSTSNAQRNAKSV